MSYEEEDTCHVFHAFHATRGEAHLRICGGGYMSYEEEDTCPTLEQALAPRHSQCGSGSVPGDSWHRGMVMLTAIGRWS